MISYLTYSSLCVFLIVLKTAALPLLPAFTNFYDILLPVVLYIGLFRPVVQGLPLVFFYGICMDSITGGPFGMYIFIYFILFISMRWIIQFVHARNILLKPLIVLAGVLVENVIILGMLTFFYPTLVVVGDLLHTAIVQLIWAAFTGPALLVLIDRLENRLGSWYAEWQFQRKEG